MRILLVEDSKPIRRENERALLKAGYEVVCALDGESAIRFAEETKPDLILLDLMLPKISGEEVLDHLKHQASTGDIPIIILSSLSERNRQKLMEAGADEYLEKNGLMQPNGVNLLPKILEDILCRISRKRGEAFTKIPVH